MKTCLLVDDSATIRKAVRRMLEALNLGVAEAGDGAEALEMLNAKPYDAVILDWNMPVMDGITLLRHMRKNAALSAIPVIMSTTEQDLARIGEALEAGANEYLMKPYDKETLEVKLSFAGVID